MEMKTSKFERLIHLIVYRLEPVTPEATHLQALPLVSGSDGAETSGLEPLLSQQKEQPETQFGRAMCLF